MLRTAPYWQVQRHASELRSRPSVRLYGGSYLVLTAMGGNIVAYASHYAMYERLSYSHVHEMK